MFAASRGIRATTHSDTLTFVKAALQNMQRIEHLFISRSSWGLYLSQILECCGDIPSVTLLDLFGISQPEEEVFKLESKVRYLI